MSHNVHAKAEESARPRAVDDWIAWSKAQIDGRIDGELHTQRELSVPLHHYTSLDGFKGIIDSNSIWASDVRFLNDASEMSYAEALISEVVHDEFRRTRGSGVSAVLEEGINSLKDFRPGERPFVACFCEAGDLLSQWRGYAANEAGVSLSFDLSLEWGPLPTGTYLRRVVYERDQQAQMIRKVLAAWSTTVEAMFTATSMEQWEPSFATAMRVTLNAALKEYHLCFKNPGFREEREWRLIRLVNVHDGIEIAARARRDVDPGVEPLRGDEVQFRPSRLGLIPFVSVSLDPHPGGAYVIGSPLRKVTLGPSGDAALALESIEEYLRSRNVPAGVQTMSTEVPMRRP